VSSLHQRPIVGVCQPTPTLRKQVDGLLYPSHVPSKVVGHLSSLQVDVRRELVRATGLGYSDHNNDTAITPLNSFNADEEHLQQDHVISQQVGNELASLIFEDNDHYDGRDGECKA